MVFFCMACPDQAPWKSSKKVICPSCKTEKLVEKGVSFDGLLSAVERGKGG